MSKVGSGLSNFIKLNFPVIKKRSALWFFSHELRNNLAKKSSRQTVVSGSDTQELASNKDLSSASSQKPSRIGEPTRRISRNKILHLWKNMDPESKRKYFNMAEFDDIRYKEQKSLWVSEVGALMMKHEGSVDKVCELAPTHERLQKEFLDSLEMLHKNYERMIQAESTKTLYKDAIKRVDNLEPCLETQDLISAIPKQHRSILTQPRRPPTAFILYLNDNLERYKTMKRCQCIEGTYLKIASEDWANLDSETRTKYEEKYQKMREEYIKAMADYRCSIALSDSSDLIEQASREKRAFKKSIRKRLRDASILPLSIRNAFNFYLMDNKDINLTDLSEVWRNLPEEQKIKYVEMSRADGRRYQNEIEAYREICKGLSELFGKIKSRSSDSMVNNKSNA